MIVHYSYDDDDFVMCVEFAYRYAQQRLGIGGVVEFVDVDVDDDWCVAQLSLRDAPSGSATLCELAPPPPPPPVCCCVSDCCSFCCFGAQLRARVAKKKKRRRRRKRKKRRRRRKKKKRKRKKKKKKKRGETHPLAEGQR